MSAHTRLMLGQRLRVIWITPELQPYIKVGGLADVSNSLAEEFDKYDFDFRLCIPYHDFIKLDTDAALVAKFEDFRGNPTEIWESKLQHTAIPVYLIRNTFYNFQSAYDGDHENQARFFTHFSWAAVEMVNKIGWVPHIFHVHDWPTALVSLFLKINKDKGIIPPNCKSLYTIHNLAYQGKILQNFLKEIDVDDIYYRDIMDDKKSFRAIRLAIRLADKMTTVSMRYGREILTSEFGYGLEDEIKQYQEQVEGIVHGVNQMEWNPKTDSFIIPYSIENLDEKFKNKENLLDSISLDPQKFTVGLVARLVYQKGLELLYNILPELEENNIQVIILGTGEPRFEEMMRKGMEQYPKIMYSYIQFSESLAHQIIAGVDAFLIPSRYEPCGLTQLYAMAYGTIPIGRNTGGLADTICSYGDKQNGFLFEKYNSHDFLKTILKAQNYYLNQKKLWRNLQLNAMTSDFSWATSAKKWFKFYSKLVE